MSTEQPTESTYQDVPHSETREEQKFPDGNDKLRSNKDISAFYWPRGRIRLGNPRLNQAHTGNGLSGEQAKHTAQEIIAEADRSDTNNLLHTDTVPSTDAPPNANVQGSTTESLSDATLLQDAADHQPDQANSQSENNLMDDRKSREDIGSSQRTYGTLGNSLDKPESVVFIQLFLGANPSWETDGVIYCHSNLHLLPRPSQDSHLTESTLNGGVGSSNTEVKQLQNHTMAANLQIDLTKDMGVFQEYIEMTESPTAKPTFPDPLPSNIAVFAQVVRGTGFLDRNSRIMSFTGYYKIIDLQFLAPGSQELVQMLKAKWDGASFRDSQRSADRWNESLSFEWAVIKLIKDEGAKDMPAPEIPKLTYGTWQSRRGGRAGQGGQGGRGAWRFSGRRGAGGQVHRGGWHDQNSWYNRGRATEPMTRPSWEPTEGSFGYIAQENGKSEVGLGNQPQQSLPPDTRRGNNGRRARYGRGQGYSHGRGQWETGNNVKEPMAESAPTTGAIEDKSMGPKQETVRPLTVHQIRNENAVSTHHTWNEYAKNVEVHDEKLMMDPKGEVMKWHASIRKANSE